MGEDARAADTPGVTGSSLTAGQAAARPSGAPESARVGPQFASVIVAAQVGAEWAWTLLYRSVAGPVLGYLRAMGAADPEDLLGEVFLQVARNIGTFSGDEDGFRSWVFVVAHHRVVDERRRRGRRPSTPVAAVPDSPGGSTEDEAMARLLSAEARALLDCLTPEQREIVLLRVFADLPLEEVSRIVRRPVSAVKALQRRAYGRLRKEIAEKGYPVGPLWQ